MALAAMSAIRALSMSEKAIAWKGKPVIAEELLLPGRRSRSRDGPDIEWGPKLPMDKSREETCIEGTGGS